MPPLATPQPVVHVSRRPKPSNAHGLHAHLRISYAAERMFRSEHRSVAEGVPNFVEGTTTLVELGTSSVPIKPK